MSVTNEVTVSIAEYRTFIRNAMKLQMIEQLINEEKDNTVILSKNQVNLILHPLSEGVTDDLPY